MRTFTELALCHLPDDEIRALYGLIDKGLTTIYANEAGFFIWRRSMFLRDSFPVLFGLLAESTADFVLFDVDVEPDPELEIFE